MSTAERVGDLAEWSEAAVARYLKTYKHGVIPDATLNELGGPMLNGRELAAKLVEPGLDRYLREAIIAALENPQRAWQECTSAEQADSLELGESFSWLKDPLLSAERSSLEISSLAVTDGPSVVRFPGFVSSGRPALIVFSSLVIVLGVIILLPVVLGSQLAGWLEYSSLGEFQLDYYRWVSVPVVFVIGWQCVVWVLLWLAFYPVEFRGCNRLTNSNVGFPLGWQGLIPFKAAEKARIAVRMLRKFIIAEQEVFARVDAKQMSDILKRPLAQKMEDVIDKIANDEAPKLWHSVPQSAKGQIIQVASAEAPVAFVSILRRLRAEIAQVLDLESAVSDLLGADLKLCSNVFLTCCEPELRYMRRVALRWAIVASLCQVALQAVFSSHLWLLPFSGLVMGAAVNGLVVLLLFKPVEPFSTLDGRIQLHGRVLERQVEIAQAVARVLAREVITPNLVIRELVHGRSKARVRQIVRDGIFTAVETSFAPFTALIPVAIQQRIVDKTGAMVNESLFGLLMHTEDYLEQAMDLERTFAYRLARLDQRSFRTIVWEVFRSELKMFSLAGAVFGLLVGIVQLIVFVSLK